MERSDGSNPTTTEKGDGGDEGAAGDADAEPATADSPPVAPSSSGVSVVSSTPIASAAAVEPAGAAAAAAEAAAEAEDNEDEDEDEEEDDDGMSDDAISKLLRHYATFSIDCSNMNGPDRCDCSRRTTKPLLLVTPEGEAGEAFCSAATAEQVLVSE